MRKGRIDKSEKSENNLTKGIKIVDLHKEKLKKEREERRKMLSDEKTENNYTRFRKAILCLIISTIIVIVILFFYFGPLVGISLNRNIGIDEKKRIDIVSTDSDIYDEYCSDLLIYSNQKVTTYNSRGVKNWEYSLANQFTPKIYIKNEFMAIANNSNGNIYLFENKKEILNTKIDGEINEIFLDENGNYVVEYSTSGYKKVLGVYSKNGKNLYNAYLSSDPIVYVEIIDGAKQLLVFQTNTSTFKVGINISMIDGSKENQIETIATLDNNFIYDLTIQNRNIIMLLDDKIVKCNIDTKDIANIYTFDSSQIMFISLSKNYYTMISKELKEENTAGYSIVSNRFDNSKISMLNITDSPKIVKNSGVLEYLVYQDSLQVINKWGIEVKNINIDFPPKDAIAFNNGKSIALIYSNKVYVVSI